MHTFVLSAYNTLVLVDKIIKIRQLSKFFDRNIYSNSLIANKQQKNRKEPYKLF